jgi:hypothetical protein
MRLELIADRTTRELVEAAMGMRQQAASMEKEAEELKRGANELLLPLFAAIGDEKVEWEGVGTISKVKGAVRGTLDKNKLKDRLLARQVPVDVIVDSFEEATSYKESADTVMFKAEKVR